MPLGGLDDCWILVGHAAAPRSYAANRPTPSLHSAWRTDRQQWVDLSRPARRIRRRTEVVEDSTPASRRSRTPQFDPEQPFDFSFRAP